eukprot:EC122828.1.p1 GENE.EC122828.1~~EC122828.1.p1  ORF type:complete len:174 (+),score=19.96 EC122828.1:81-602(+)
MALVASGKASFYGTGFHGRRTACGDVFNMNALTAAHRSLPCGTYVRVTNLDNQKTVVVKITDRGPFAPGRVIDLSKSAAMSINMINTGVVPVRLEVVKNSDITRSGMRQFSFGNVQRAMLAFQNLRPFQDNLGLLCEDTPARVPSKSISVPRPIVQDPTKERTQSRKSRAEFA